MLSQAQTQTFALEEFLSLVVDVFGVLVNHFDLRKKNISNKLVVLSSHNNEMRAESFHQWPPTNQPTISCRKRMEIFIWQHIIIVIKHLKWIQIHVSPVNHIYTSKCHFVYVWFSFLPEWSSLIYRLPLLISRDIYTNLLNFLSSEDSIGVESDLTNWIPKYWMYFCFFFARICFTFLLCYCLFLFLSSAFSTYFSSFFFVIICLMIWHGCYICYFGHR